MTVRATVQVSSLRELEAFALGLAFASWQQMRDPRNRGRIPKLYESRIRYRQEPQGVEEWRTALQTAQIGHGDCEDLVIYRVAELWMGEDPQARPHVIEVNPRLRHVVVKRGNGQLEDPSARLGM